MTKQTKTYISIALRAAGIKGTITFEYECCKVSKEVEKDTTEMIQNAMNAYRDIVTEKSAPFCSDGIRFWSIYL